MFIPLGDDEGDLPAPRATLAMVVANVVVFLYVLFLPAPARVHFAHAVGLVPSEIVHWPAGARPYAVLTLFTAMFVHGDLLHLLGNLCFLWVFGGRLERTLGIGRFLALYTLVGVVAAALQVASAPSSNTPMIGASGAIAGLLGAYAISFPRARIRCLLFVGFFITFVAVPASLLLGVWLALQLHFARSGEPGVAWFAHIGGFVAGIACALGVAGWRRAAGRRAAVSCMLSP